MSWLNYMQKNKFGVYEYKRRIPKDLLANYPECRSGVIKFSLKTKDKAQAALLNKQEDARLELEFASKRQHNSVSPEIRQKFSQAMRRLRLEVSEDIDLASLTKILDELKKSQEVNAPLPWEAEDVVALSALSDNPEKVAGRNRDLAYRQIIDTIEAMIEAFDGDSPDFRAIKIRYSKIHSIRIYERKVAAGSDQVKTDVKVSVPSSIPTLSGMAEIWLNEHSKPPAEKTIREWRTSVRRFEQLHGVMPVNQINKAHLREFRDSLRIVPSHSKPSDNFKDLVRLAKENDRSGQLSNATINKNLTAIKSILEVAIRYDYIDSNPAAKILLDDNPYNEEKRLVFDADDLKRIFHSPMFIGHLSARQRSTEGRLIIKDAYYWLPLLALFTGARQAELAQLQVKDIALAENQYCFLSINSDNGRSLKTKSSKRIIPIHRHVMACGFFEFVNSRKLEGHTWLFPELLKENRINTSAYSKAFARFLDSVGTLTQKRAFTASGTPLNAMCVIL